MNRHGMVQDIIFWAIIIFIFGIGLLVSGKLNTEFVDNYQNSSAGDTAKNIQKSYTDRFYAVWDSSFLFVFIILGVAMITVLYYLSSTPALFFMGILLLAFALIPIGIIGNSFDEAVDSTLLQPEAANLIITTWLMDHILQMGVVLGFIALVLLFARSNGGY